MNENKDTDILHGPKSKFPVAEGTAGQHFYNALLKHVKKPVAMVSAETGESVSYEQILITTCLLAQSLEKIGLTQNNVISVCNASNVYFLYPVIAALYLGVITAPLNENYTDRELCNALEIAKPLVMFCSKTSLNKILKLKKLYSFLKTIIVLDSTEDVGDVVCFNNFLKTNSNVDTNAKDFIPRHFDRDKQVALIMCSSGTTGLPKGVMLTHKNIVTRFSYCSNPDAVVGMNITPGHTILNFLPFCHIGGLITTLEYLYRGLQVILLQQYNQKAFLKTIQDYKVEVMAVVPTVLVFLAKSTLINQYDLSSLKEIVVAGDLAAKDIQDAVRERLNLKPIRQAYGLTESTLSLTLMPENDFRAGSSGKLLPNISAKIIDPNTGEVLKRNETGELCFKGNVVMKCYAGNDEATKNTLDKDGWLKTGDLGYFDSDGYLYLVGRYKELIKYKSFQVAPAELEELLLEHPGVQEAAVIGMPDEVCGELPTAFIVSKSKKEFTEKDIQDYVAEKVSPYKRLRGGVRFVEEIPKNSTGKIQRMVLRDLLKN